MNIIDSTGENKLCGKERTVYKNELCSNVIYVVYVAPNEQFRMKDYRGFKLYYESMLPKNQAKKLNIYSTVYIQ